MGLSPIMEQPKVARIINGADYEPENESLDKNRDVVC